MSDLRDFLSRMVGHLEATGVEYMLARSIASTFHGTPRATQDLDVVLELSKSALEALLSALGDEDYYVNADAARDALRCRGQFNVIDMSTGWKADLILKKRRPFSDVEFERRERATVLGVPLWVASAEDTVVSKLEWARESGGSERQLRDVAGILELKGRDLDIPYVERWCDELGLGDLWSRVRGSE